LRKIFLVAKLTGNCVTDHSMACGTLMYDIKHKGWSRRILEQYSIPEDKLPELKWSGDLAGTLLSEVARELGLSETCIVAVGAQDQRCASLGAGLKEGVVTLSLGTAGAICKIWDEARTEGDTRIGWCAYVNEDSWVTEGVIETAASCLRWLRDTMYPSREYDVINKEAEEALNRGSKLILEAMGGCDDVHTLVLFGGGSKSPLWCQIIADVGMEIVVPATAEAAGARAAVLAGIAAGEYARDKSPSLSYKKSYQPGERQEMYRKKYERYRDIEYRIWRCADHGRLRESGSRYHDYD